MTTIPGIDALSSQKIFGLFQLLPQQTEVILFGSRAKGSFREGSDIDLALKGPAITLEHRDLLLNKYEECFLPWKLDVVVYSLITEPMLQQHIDRMGKNLRS